MTYEEVHYNKEVLLLQVVSGSRAYGLDTPHKGFRQEECGLINVPHSRDM